MEDVLNKYNKEYNNLNELVISDCEEYLKQIAKTFEANRQKGVKIENVAQYVILFFFFLLLNMYSYRFLSANTTTTINWKIDFPSFRRSTPLWTRNTRSPLIKSRDCGSS